MGNCFAKKKVPVRVASKRIEHNNSGRSSAGTGSGTRSHILADDEFDETKSFTSAASGFSNFFSFKSYEEKKEKKTFHDAYFIGEKLGTGAFAQVHVIVRLKADKVMMRAVKIVDLRLANPKLYKLIEKEIHVWKKVGKHEHCVRLFDVFYGSNLCYMIMERCSSSLVKYLERVPGLSERSYAKVFLQMLMAIRHLHVFHVVHRDIKPDNFLVGGDDGNTIKLTDFGLSASLPTDGTKITGECGTAPFMSPEMLSGQKYDEKTDVWSFGVVVHCLLFGRFPHNTSGRRNSAEIKKAVAQSNAKISFRGRVSCAGVAFSMLLLKRDPDKRPSADAAMELAFTAEARDDSSIEWPSLLDTLRLAKHNQVFDSAQHNDNHGLDDFLNSLQIQKHGKGIPAHKDQESVLMSLERSATKSTMTGTGKKSEGALSRKGSVQSLQSQDTDDSGTFCMSEGSSACSV